MISIKNEGIHLTAIVRYANPRPGEPTGYMKMEDNDYNSKADFKRDLRSNGYAVRTVWDNRDLYVIDNSDYKGLSDLARKISELKSMVEDENNKEKYPALYRSYMEELDRLTDLYNKAVKVKL